MPATTRFIVRCTVLAVAALCAALFTRAPVPTAHAATFTVNSADDTDDGLCDSTHCSLREAILAANAASGSDTIEFAIGSGLATIQPNSSALGLLPDITEPLTIDGSTQPGYAGAPLIELDGSLAGAGARGFQVIGGATTLRALVINSFSYRGVQATTNSSTLAIIEDSYLGTDPTGTIDDGNGTAVFADAFANVQITDSLISGNGQAVTLNTGYGTITNNKIGTDVTGTLALGNGGGIRVHEGFASIGSNVISGNTSFAIALSRDPFESQPSALIGSNYIGTDLTGTYAIPNGGGVEASAGLAQVNSNVISGNTGAAIWTSNTTGRTFAMNNLIGTNAAGTAAIPNGHGFLLTSTNLQNPGAIISFILFNVIAGNSDHALWVEGEKHTISGNKIGVLSDGSTPAGNGSYGIYLKANSTGVYNNIIANNGADGIVIDGGDFNEFQSNSIYSNGEAGISLVSGGNQDIAPPVLTSVNVFSVTGTACANCTVQVFTDAADEGRNYHGTVTASAAGDWSFPHALVGRITATQSSVPNVTGVNTSAFATHVLRTGPDTDNDGLDDTTDNCPGFSSPDPANHDLSIDLSPLKAFDDATWANSDAMGDACDSDDDNDGLSDALEATNGGPCPSANIETDPFDWDTDDDLVLDGAECALSTDPGSYSSKPTQAQCGTTSDADADGVLNFRETCFYGTSNASANTDGDGCGDRREIASVNGDAYVNVIDLQQVASETGAYTNFVDPDVLRVKMAYDVTKNSTIDVIDLQQVAAASGYCP